MRAFVAIRIPLQFREVLAGEAVSLTQISRHTRPATVGNLHLTLAFLGNVASQSTDSVISAMETAATGFKPLRLGFGPGGTFPLYGEPRIAWVGVTGDLEPLNKLQGSITENMRGIGIRVDKRPFSPHITLARIGRQATPSDRISIRRALEDLDLNHLGQFVTHGISLIESELTIEGASHQELLEVEFRQGRFKRKRRRFGLF